MTKRWINTKVEYEWDEDLNKLVEVSKEGYWYDGPTLYRIRHHS